LDDPHQTDPALKRWQADSEPPDACLPVGARRETLRHWSPRFVWNGAHLAGVLERSGLHGLRDSGSKAVNQGVDVLLERGFCHDVKLE
jgi:hypothetical protein